MAYKGFQRLHGTLRKLADVPSQAARAASARIADVIEQQFDSGTDPYGRAWAPLKPYTLAKGRFPPPLTDTREMRESVEVRPTASGGIEVTMGVDYATFHQTGTRDMAQRQIMPQSGGLPASWSSAIADAVREATRKAMG